MSDQNNTDDDKSFLSRWSQRKQEAKQPDRDAPVADADVSSGPVAESEAVPEFDLSSLPKLEDLTATTDMTAFLRKGVPEHLRNAALRKSWALDPAIRNYVNPAMEYAYDWNTPGGVPGNGELEAGMDIARMVSQIMGSGEPVLEPALSTDDPKNQLASDPALFPEDNATQEPEPNLPARSVRLDDETIPVAQKPAIGEDVARIDSKQAKSLEERDGAAPQQTVRRHGSAKPLG